MEYKDVLSAFKDKLMDLLAEDIEEGIDQIKTVIKDTSDKKMEIHGFDGQLTEVNRDASMGTIKYEDKVLFRNKVRMGMMNWIDQLEIEDIQLEENPYLSEESIRILSAAVESPMQIQTGDTAPIVAMVTGKNWEDLMIYKEKHQEILRYYPVLNRHISGQVYRKVKDEQLVGQLISDLEQHKASLLAFKMLLETANAKYWEIKRFEKGAFYFVQLEQFKTFKSQLKEDNIKAIEEQLEKIKMYNQELKAADLI